MIEFNDVKQAFRAQPGYVTPKVDMRGVLIQDGKILMVREALDGGWTLPGGWADVGETPSVAVIREVFEETGLSCRVQRLVGVYDANRVEGALDLYHAYKLVFLCERISGELMSSAETSEVGFSLWTSFQARFHLIGPRPNTSKMPSKHFTNRTYRRCLIDEGS